MEPPAVTSCNVNHVSGLGGGSQHVNKREMPVEFLQIEPQLSFNNTNRHFEELPENFLETISPQQTGGQSSISSLNLSAGHHHHDGSVVVSPQLASLTAMSVSGADGGYASLFPMPVPPHYVSHFKMDTTQHLNHNTQLHSNSFCKSTFGTGPAGLLSPLQLDGGNRDQNLGLIGVHRPNGRTSEMLSGIRRPVSYIKEEITANDMGFQGASDYDSGFSLQQPSQQELERMANAETPPALSNVEIASSILASLSNDSPTSPNQVDNSHNNHFVVHHMQHQQQQPSMQQHQHQQQMMAAAQQHHRQQQQQSRNMMNNNRNINSMSGKMKSDPHHHGMDKDIDYPGTSQSGGLVMDTTIHRYGTGILGPGAGVPRATYSTTDTTDPLNAEIDDDIYIDTKDLCKRVAYELKQHSIPQAIFAERILCRSQGTLSDLLRNPKPWNRLKSGRETFRRMFNWLRQPLHIRLSILDMYKGPMGSTMTNPSHNPNLRQHSRMGLAAAANDENGHPHPKRPRLVFTDIQKRTLQAIFKETQRPSREMQQTIAEHLNLDMSTVSNFFMNARRRSRNGSAASDEPAPYQQVRPITPPPDSPPQRTFSSTATTGGNNNNSSNIGDNIAQQNANLTRQRSSFGNHNNSSSKSSLSNTLHSFNTHHHQHEMDGGAHQGSNHLHHDMHQQQMQQHHLVSQHQHHHQQKHIDETVDEVVAGNNNNGNFSVPMRGGGYGSEMHSPPNPAGEHHHSSSSLWETNEGDSMRSSQSMSSKNAMTRSIQSNNRTIMVKVEHEVQQRQSSPSDDLVRQHQQQQSSNAQLSAMLMDEEDYLKEDTVRDNDEEEEPNEDFDNMLSAASPNDQEDHEHGNLLLEEDEERNDDEMQQRADAEDDDDDDDANAPTAPGTPMNVDGDGGDNDVSAASPENKCDDTNTSKRKRRADDGE